MMLPASISYQHTRITYSLRRDYNLQLGYYIRLCLQTWGIPSDSCIVVLQFYRYSRRPFSMQFRLS